MPRICYVDKNFRELSLKLIEVANVIIDEFSSDGLALTLRQLYYQFVARDLLPNSDKSYDMLGSVINDARLAGLIDWNAIEDRGRNLRSHSTWDDPADLIATAAQAFAIDRWADQDNYVEVWVEKQALEAVVGQACDPWQVPYFACKGYTSQSEMWRAAQRFEEHYNQAGVIIHLGDHDPSGIDMTRDIVDRLNSCFRVEVEVERIALNMDQIKKYKPPNPAKLSDSRARGYIDAFGKSSWELDALNPKTLRGLIDRAIASYCDEHRYQAKVDEETKMRKLLDTCSDRWDEVAEMLEEG
jgi:hypothetical protein